MTTFFCSKTFFLKMGRRNSLTATEISSINAYKECGLTNRQIAKKLARSHNVINNYCKMKENYGRNWNLEGNKKVDTRTERRIFQNAVNSHMSAKEIKTEMQLSVTTRRVQQILKRNPNAAWRKRVPKPKLTLQHSEHRLAFAQLYMSWSNRWQNVIFSDEKKFNLDGPDGSQYYWHDLRKEPETCYSRNFGGGTVMLWGGFSFKGTLPLAWISTKMTAKNYTNLLEISLVEHAKHLMGPNFIFQHDNASIHSAKATKEWLREKEIEVLQWPACSPDLNPIENLWGIVSRDVYSKGRQFKSVSELKARITQSWDQLPVETLQNLVKSMPHRIFEVILSKGRQIKY